MYKLMNKSTAAYMFLAKTFDIFLKKIIERILFVDSMDESWDRLHHDSESRQEAKERCKTGF